MIRGINFKNPRQYILFLFKNYIISRDPPLQRDLLKRKLKEDHAVSLGGDLYDRPCHSQPLFARHPETVVAQRGDSFPETDYVVSNHVCLPLYFDLTDEEVDYVVDALQGAVLSISSR